MEVTQFDRIAQSSTLCCCPRLSLTPFSVLGVDSMRKGSSDNKIQKILPRSTGADQLAQHPHLDSPLSKIYTSICESESERH